MAIRLTMPIRLIMPTRLIVTMNKNDHSPCHDQFVRLDAQATFRAGMEGWLKRMAALFSSERERRTFLINNLHRPGT